MGFHTESLSKRLYCGIVKLPLRYLRAWPSVLLGRLSSGVFACYVFTSLLDLLSQTAQKPVEADRHCAVAK